MGRTTDPEAAADALTESTIAIDTDRFRSMMTGLIRNGMPPAEARFHAATSLSDASYSELADAFGVSKGSISSASNDARKTIRHTKNLFLRFVDGPKSVLEHIRFGGGGGFSKHTHQYIVRYHGPEPDGTDEEQWGVVDYQYGVIELTYGGAYDDIQTFESFDITRYYDIDALADEYYHETTFEDIRDAYGVRTMLEQEGASVPLLEPEDQLTYDAREDVLHRNGKVYAKQEVADCLSTMEGHDGPIKYDDSFVDVYWHGGDEYSIREATSGLELSRVEGEYAPDIATLYEEVGPRLDYGHTIQ